MRLTIAYSKIKKRNLVLINNDTHQRETVSERPIRPPLRYVSLRFLIWGVRNFTDTHLSIYLCTVSQRTLAPWTKSAHLFLSSALIPISLEEGAAGNDIIFPSLPWSSLSVGTRDHFHKNAFGKTHVTHSANMTKPGVCFTKRVLKYQL